jgi:hypothetical protein
MNVTVVEQRNGKPHIRWAAAILLSCVLGIFTSAVAIGLYYMLAGTFSLPAALIGFGGPFITVGSGIMREMKKPVAPAH